MHFIRSLRSLGPRYRVLWVGQTVSQFGTYVAFITIPLLVFHIQEGMVSHTIDFSLAYALETAPTLLVGLIGGVFLDRIHLRPVMVATDLLRACAFFYLAAGVDDYGVATVFVIAFIVGSMTTLFDGALYAMLPALVPRDRLSDANALVTASIQISFALGPLVGGILAYAFAGPAVGLFINGVTFVISAWTLRYVGRVAHPAAQKSDEKSFLREFLDGVRHIWNEPRLRVSTLAAAIPNFVIGFLEATFVVLGFVVLLAETEAEIGVLYFFMGVGGLIGALFAPRLTRLLGLGRAMVAGLALAGAALLGVMFTTFGPIPMALLAVFMVGISVINIPLATIRQHYAGEGMLGRVVSAARALGWATLPLGALVGGWLGDSPDTYPWIARIFPLILLGCALWLSTTVIWNDTFGPEYRRGSHEAPARGLRARPGPIGGEPAIDVDTPSGESAP